MGVTTDSSRMVAEESPVALVHDGSATAVLMASPTDLEDLALGFTLTEGLVDDLGSVRAIEVVRQSLGFEARIWLAHDASVRLAARRRRLAGPTGCGLCGIESLSEAVRAAPRVQAELQVRPEALIAAMAAMSERQGLGVETRAAHAAAFWRSGAIVALREDVGRHNALDKLAGALAGAGEPTAGVVLLTSRVSVEMVQKSAALGAPVICAISAPTTLAVEAAQAAGVTLAAVCRADGFEVFSHPHRIVL